MVKIKQKKTMNLPQLIEWGFKNDIKNKSYKTNDTEGYELYFDEYGTPRFSSLVNKFDTFTIEVEEEITEDTVIPKMIETYLDRERDFDYVDIHRSLSINNVKFDDNFECKSITFHIINDDGTHTLIWRDGKLVE